eukprot:253384-Hanusia_phi.AAC.2
MSVSLMLEPGLRRDLSDSTVPGRISIELPGVTCPATPDSTRDGDNLIREALGSRRGQSLPPGGRTYGPDGGTES